MENNPNILKDPESRVLQGQIAEGILGMKKKKEKNFSMLFKRRDHVIHRVAIYEYI